MRSLVVAAAVVCVSGCTDVTSLLAEGRIADAGLAACARPEERARVEAWLVEHAPVRFAVVSQNTLAAALGGPVAIDPDIGLVWDVDGVVPQASMVAVDVSPSMPLTRLVEWLPPLAVVDRVPVVAPVDPATLQPTPLSGRPSGDFVGNIIDASMAAGEAVGVMVAAPAVAVVSAVGGIFDAFFGRSGSSRSPVERVPVMSIAAVDGSTSDALLSAEELRVVNARAQETWQTMREHTLAEQQRRIALLDDKNLLSPGDCASGHCRVLLKAVPDVVGVDVVFAREDAFEQRCAYAYQAHTVTTGESAAALVPATVDVNAEVNAARAFAQITTPLQPRTPWWSVQHSAALPKTLAPRVSPTTTKRIEHLGCTLRLKRGWRGGDWSPKVLASFGREHSRVSSVTLGSPADAVFIVHDVGLVPDERARLSVKELGAAIVTFDGSTPLVFENRAFRAECAEAPHIDDDVVNKALATANTAVQQVAADTNASPRPRFELRDRHEREAQAAVQAVAALVGFNDARLTPLLAVLDAIR